MTTNEFSIELNITKTNLVCLYPSLTIDQVEKIYKILFDHQNWLKGFLYNSVEEYIDNFILNDKTSSFHKPENE